MLTFNTADQSTAVDRIVLRPIARTIEIEWNSDTPWRYGYRARRRDMIRAAIAYAFCQPISWGRFANGIKHADSFALV